MNRLTKYRVEPGSRVQLKNWETSSFLKGLTKEHARVRTEENAQAMAALQYRLYAENKRSLLVVLQGMDTSGKDGTMRRVLGALNPQGCRVTSFKKPTEEELAHDFLWRVHPHAPGAGRVAVFNRSHYEDVLIVRVHKWVRKSEWTARFARINEFESLLASRGTVIRKFFLHISREEQKQRFEARLQDPDKLWKFNEADIAERAYWDDYQKAYADALQQCSTRQAPWYIIPSDQKWLRNYLISEILLDTMKRMNPRPPEVHFDPAAISIPD